jgi:hypothetical protein
MGGVGRWWGTSHRHDRKKVEEKERKVEKQNICNVTDRDVLSSTGLWLRSS